MKFNHLSNIIEILFSDRFFLTNEESFILNLTGPYEDDYYK